MKDWNYVILNLKKYKDMINFNDQMEKSNFKWINQVLSKNIKNKVDLEGSIILIDGAIQLQIFWRKAHYFSGGM